MYHKLEKIVSNKNHVFIQMINRLAKEERWVSVKELSQEIRVVERTILRYIIDLSEVIKHCNEQLETEYVLQMKKSRGVKLVIHPTETVSQLVTYLYHSDETVNLFKELLLGRHYSSAVTYAQQKNVSIHAARVSLEKIQVLLQGTGVSLSIWGVELVGEETQIRRIGFSFFKLLFKNDKLPTTVTKVDSIRLTAAIDKLTTSLHLELTQGNRQHLSYMLAFNIWRYRQNKPIQSNAAWERYIPLTNQAELIPLVENIYRSFHIYSAPEVNFMVVNILMTPSVYNIGPLKQAILSSHQKKETDIVAATDLVMLEFGRTFQSVSPAEYESVYFHLFRSHMSAKVYIHGDFDFDDYWFPEVIPSYFGSYQTKMRAFIRKLYQSSQNELFLEEHYLIKTYFLILSTSEWMQIIDHPLYIYCEMDIAGIYDRRLKEYLTSRFGATFHLIFLENKYTRTPTLTLTNLPSNSMDRLTISYPFRNRDIVNIEDKLTKLKQELQERTDQSVFM